MSTLHTPANVSNARSQCERVLIIPAPEQIIAPWHSLSALTRDIDGVQNQNQTLSQQLWTSENTSQNLKLQIENLVANLERSDRDQSQLQQELHQGRLDVEIWKNHQVLMKQCLEREAHEHTETKKHLRCLIALLNRLKFSGSSQELGPLVPGDYQIQTLLRENDDLKEEQMSKRAQLECLNQTINDVQKEKEDLSQALARKASELNRMHEGSETQVDTTKPGKRKRGAGKSI